jgi:hypothetical protein
MLYCLLFRGLEQQGETTFVRDMIECPYSDPAAPHLLDFSPDGVTFVTDITRQQILRIVNTVWDDGLYITFGLLPAIIAV